MTVTEARQAWGDFDLTLKPDTPRSIINKLNTSWYAMIRIYPQEVDVTQVGAAPPLFTGVLLDRDNRWNIGGASATWYLGEATDGTGSDETGPLTLSTITKNGTTNGALAGWLPNIIDDTNTGLTLGDVGGPADTTKYAGTFTRRTAKTMLDAWICPRFKVEYRVNPDLTIDVGYPWELYPTPTPMPMAIKNGGRDAQILGLNASELGLQQSTRDRMFRAITVISDPATYQTVYQDSGAWPYKNPLGDDLNWTVQVSGTASSQDDVGAANGEAQANSEKLIQDAVVADRSITISSREYALTSRVKPGEFIYVYDVEEGLFDMGNQVLFRGQTMYPVLLRIEEATWPVERGMSVHLDNRHHGGSNDVTDLTPYVDFTSDGEDTTIVVGAPPKTLGRVVRSKR